MTELSFRRMQRELRVTTWMMVAQTVLIVIILALLCAQARAGQRHLLYDVNGVYAGSLVTVGRVTSYYRHNGRLIRPVAPRAMK
jgi:hypothetical protein